MQKEDCSTYRLLISCAGGFIWEVSPGLYGTYLIETAKITMHNCGWHQIIEKFVLCAIYSAKYCE